MKALAITILMIASCSTSTTQKNSTATILKANGIDTVFDFNNDPLDKCPTAWKPVNGTWRIADDNGNKALMQSAKNQGSTFNVCVLHESHYQNPEMKVRVKALEGNEDQGGGLVWRYQDEKNYYVMRANPLENNFRLYKVVDGNRKQLESANVKIKTGEWFIIKVIMNGNEMNCYYNDQLLMSHTDDTFSSAGKIGFWSKADAVSLFDDLSIMEVR